MPTVRPLPCALGRDALGLRLARGGLDDDRPAVAAGPVGEAAATWRGGASAARSGRASRVRDSGSSSASAWRVVGRGRDRVIVGVAAPERPRSSAPARASASAPSIVRAAGQRHDREDHPDQRQRASPADEIDRHAPAARPRRPLCPQRRRRRGTTPGRARARCRSAGSAARADGRRDRRVGRRGLGRAHERRSARELTNGSSRPLRRRRAVPRAVAAGRLPVAPVASWRLVRASALVAGSRGRRRGRLVSGRRVAARSEVVLVAACAGRPRVLSPRGRLRRSAGRVVDVAGRRARRLEPVSRRRHARSSPRRASSSRAARPARRAACRPAELGRRRRA